jgi:hypothetical protein
MHNELRYQEKTHAISEKLSKEKNKIRHLLPNFLFFLVENQYIEKQQDMLMEKEMTSSPSM